MLRLGRAAIVVVGASVVAVLVLGAQATAAYYGTEKTNYREFARIVREAPDDALVVVGPVDHRTIPWIKSYLAWEGVDRPVRYLAVGDPPPALPLKPGGVVWLTGSPPNLAGLKTRALNDVGNMQVIAGDRSVGQSILPWFVSHSLPPDAATLKVQGDQISLLAPFLAAP